MLTQFVLCVVNVRFFLLLHMNCCWLVYWLFFSFFMFFVHLCTCIISLSCKCGQNWWVFVPLWQPASAFLYACAYCVLRRINMMIMMMSVCLSVCLRECVCPRSHLRDYTSDLHQIVVHVTYGRGSDLPWRRSDTLCTSGFTDDVIFAHKPRLLDVAVQLKSSARAALGSATKCAQ